MEEPRGATWRLLQELTQVHAELVTQGAQRALFERLLALVLELTHSEGGLIAEVHRSPEGKRSLRAHAVTGIPWSEEPREPSAPPALELRELEPLLEAALTSGEPVLAQDAGSGSQEPPSGAPRPRTFLGLPFRIRGEVEGVVGLANRPGGYDEAITTLLQPVLTTCGTLLHAWRDDERRRQGEQTLAQQAAEKAERLQLALESAADGMWDLDIRSGSFTASTRWLRMLGHDETTLRPTLTLWREQLCHPEDLPEAERRLGEHLEGRSPMYELEHRLRHRNGHWVWVLCRAKVVERDEHGRPLRVVGTNVDITSRRHAQEQLQTIIQAIPDMIFRMRVDGTCLGFKPSTVDAPQMPPEKFLGKNLYELPLPPSLLTPLRASLERVSAGSPLEVFEYSLGQPSAPLHYEARIVASGPDEGLCIVRNITARKAMEEQRHRHAEELEERVRQVTRELEARQAQLIQSEKLASLGQMAASIAHEINNPMGYISSNVATLASYTAVLRRLLELYLQAVQGLEALVPAPVAELLEQARALREQENLEEILQDMDELQEDLREGVTRIREFLQDLKAFVREESGTPQLADLNRGLLVTLRMLRHELRHKCEVRCDFAPLPLVRCLPTQLNQVFMNLLLNAAQAIERQGEIHVTSRQEGEEVVVRITDTGHGMGPETLAKLFTPFFTTKPPGEGTGLGLSICYAIISRHQGRIEVQSEPGRGTTFTVRLPLTVE